MLKDPIGEDQEAVALNITLKKQAKGGYTWDIKTAGWSAGDIVGKVEEADRMMRERFGEIE